MKKLITAIAFVLIAGSANAMPTNPTVLNDFVRWLNQVIGNPFIVNA